MFDVSLFRGPRDPAEPVVSAPVEFEASQGRLIIRGRLLSNGISITPAAATKAEFLNLLVFLRRNPRFAVTAKGSGRAFVASIVNEVENGSGALPETAFGRGHFLCDAMIEPAALAARRKERL